MAPPVLVYWSLSADKKGDGKFRPFFAYFILYFFVLLYSRMHLGVSI